MKYSSFIDSKKLVIESVGFNQNVTNDKLFDYQKDIVKWALKKGKAAIFAMTGLGKTFMQVEWAYRIFQKTNKPILILAPLAVAEQTVEEAKKIGIEITYAREDNEINNGIYITNYEILHKFDCTKFIGVVLDESSILKSFTGKVRTLIIESVQNTPYKLACTAIPSPNDYMELGNHCEFLNIMSRNEMLSMFFVHDGGDTSKWRLKGHAQKTFWE